MCSNLHWYQTQFITGLHLRGYWSDLIEKVMCLTLNDGTYTDK